MRARAVGKNTAQRFQFVDSDEAKRAACKFL